MQHIKLFEGFVNEQQYWGSIGAGILPVCRATGRVLVGLRSDSVMEPNTWGTFGGKLDIDEGVDESIKEAALRELQEETYYMGPMKLVDAFIYRDGDRFSYHNFFGIVPEEFEAELNWENDDAVWMSLSQLNRLSPKHFGLSALLKNSMDILVGLLGSAATMDEEEPEEEEQDDYSPEEEDEELDTDDADFEEDDEEEYR